MKKAKAIKESRSGRPALTPEARENQMISLAIDLAERQLREGTASSQVITHFLKLGSTKERLEMDILREQKGLVQAKTKAYASAEEIKELYKDAMEAMKQYGGHGGAEEYED